MFNRFCDLLHAVAIALWAGGTWTIGYLVAPTLFRAAPDRHIAGHLAGKMFTSMAYVALACATIIVVLRFRAARFGVFRQGVTWIVVVMTTLVIAGEFGVQPILASLKEQAFPRAVMESVFRDRFAAWHGVASVLYLIQSVLAVVLVYLNRRSGG